MYEYSTYKLKIGKYGKYIALLDEKDKIIINIGLDKQIQEKITIYNLNQEVLDKLLIIHSNKIMNQNLNKNILKMLSEKEIEPEIDLCNEQIEIKEDFKIKFLYNQV